MKESKELSIKEQLIGVIMTPFIVLPMLLLIAPIALFNAWATWLMYGWFLYPLGLPKLSLWHVLGLLMFWGLLRISSFSENRKYTNSILKIVVWFFATLFILGVGYIIKSWI